MTASKEFDVVVIGGGPAGSAAATILAQHKHRVALVEREKFPRYTVGESMLPFCFFPLARLNLIEKLKSSNFVHKHSVQFVRKDGQISIPFYFSDHLAHEAAMTWQVERREFDLMALNNAIEHGVSVFQQTKALSFITNGKDHICGLNAKSELNGLQEFRSNLVVDASGQSVFSASRMGWRIPDPKLKKIAIWSYYKDAMRDSGRDEGATTIAYLDGKNWVWYIPLQNNQVSVGVVGDIDYLYSGTRNPDEIFSREINKNAWIKQHLNPATKIDRCRVTADVSYRSRHCSAPGLLLTGDAFSFLDPVFSSGLYLALFGGVLAGETAVQALNCAKDEHSVYGEYSNSLRGVIETMRKLIYAFYDPDFSFGAMIKNYPDLKGDLTDCLIGNLDRDFTNLFSAFSEFVQLPEPLDYGLPAESKK